ncbi:MAG: ABC transporter permease [Cyclobacteriaceae bacterium]|nr:ABC transporter permease [Cyclobacteriaceae bacterium]
MWLLKLAWKNMWRNRHRTIIAMASIFFAVLLTVVTSSLQKGVFDNMVRNVVSFYSGYLQVQHREYWDERILDNTFQQSDTLEDIIRGNRNVTAVAPRLESFALASSEELTKGCMVVGIRPEQEDQITRLSAKVIAGKYLGDGDRGVLMGEGLAERLRVNVNDTLVLLGQGYQGATAAGKYAIQGVLKFGSPDLNNQFLFLSLQEAQRLYSAEQRLTSYVLGLNDPDRLGEAESSLQASVGTDLTMITWEEMMPEMVQHIETDQGSMLIIQGILYVLVGLGILGTLLMMMIERKYEMGMLVAIGMKKFKLMQLMIVESVATVLTGCGLGLLASFPVVYWLTEHPIRFTGEVGDVYEEFGFEPIFPATLDPGIFINQGLVVLGVGLLLSLYPIVRIAQLDPVEAMKK